MHDTFPLKSYFRNQWRRSGICSGQLPTRPLMLTVVFIVLIALTGCRTPIPKLPPPDVAGPVLPGKVVWHDLVTPDMNQAKAFYSGLLGWTFEDITQGYSVAKIGDQLIAGIAELNLSGRPSHWVSHLSVADMDHTLAYVISAGGQVILKPFDLAGRGKIALVKDPQGAAFGILQSSEGDPVDREPVVNGWLWNEIWTGDVPGAIGFYREIADYRVAERRIDNNTYSYLEHAGHPRVGFLKKPVSQIDNTWVAYIRVADIGAALKKVETLGGKVLVPPQQAIRNGRVAVVTDPDGAGFILQERHK